MVQILLLRKLGFKFMVHPTGFCVHRWHPVSSASEAYRGRGGSLNTRALDLKAHWELLYNKVRGRRCHASLIAQLKNNTQGTHCTLQPGGPPCCGLGLHGSLHCTA